MAVFSALLSSCGPGVGDILDPRVELHHVVVLLLLLWAFQPQIVIFHCKPVFDAVSQGLKFEISMQLWTQKQQRSAVDVVRWVEVAVADVIIKMLRI